MGTGQKQASRAKYLNLRNTKWIKFVGSTRNVYGCRMSGSIWIQNNQFPTIVFTRSILPVIQLPCQFPIDSEYIMIPFWTTMMHPSTTDNPCKPDHCSLYICACSLERLYIHVSRCQDLVDKRVSHYHKMCNSFRTMSRGPSGITRCLN